MTLLESAKKSKIPSEISQVAKKENVSKEFLLQKIAQGKIVIPKSTSLFCIIISSIIIILAQNFCLIAEL